MGRNLRRLGRIVAVLMPFALAACQTFLKPHPPVEDGPAVVLEPTVGADPTIKALACDLDHLEKHIEWYGSVTAKVPDVWGQARLTQYRDEFEKTMAADISGFTFVLNGSESRSDQSFFASATALSFAVQPPAPRIGSVTTNKAMPSLVPTAQTVQQQIVDKASGSSTTTNTTYGSPPQTPAPTPIKPLDVPEPKDLVSSTDSVITRTPVALPKALPFANASAGIGIEPTEYLAQKKRYLDFLNQLRRENEGDDTADSPGYSLNLMRIPVSILPGKKTEIGHAAEITMSLNPVLGIDLLPMTFRNLLVNDVENQLGFPMTQILNPSDDADIQQYLNDDFQRFVHIITRLNDYESIGGTWGNARKEALLRYLRLPKNDPDRRWRESHRDREALRRYATEEMKDYFADNEVFLRESDARMIPLVGAAPGRNPVVRIAGQEPAPPAPLSAPLPLLPGPIDRKNTRTDDSQKAKERNAKSLSTRSVSQVMRAAAGSRALSQFNTPTLSFSNGLDNRTGFPTSQMLDVYGPEAMFDMLYAAQKALKYAIDKQKYAHLPDVQAYLREEVRAAYEFLKKNPDIWTPLCDENLILAIRSQRWEEVTRIRQTFRYNVAQLTKSEPTEKDRDFNYFDPFQESLHLSRTTGFAWCLIVDAALLNDRLIRDMKETASAKGKALVGCDHWCQYFLPDPLPECRQAFNEYVKLRWPIHVFALDPYIQEQNIADSLSTRREMQLALAIAFTNGQISARNLTKYTRRLEAEYQTISLNRTQIGFSHGENTFGWRFYPRYQTPDTPSNAEDLIRNQFIGGPNRNQLLRQRRLEPGIRECVAIVMMPSFVPYVNVDTVSDWFPITNPKHKCFETAHAMKLSHTVQTLKVSGCGVKDACKYRDGEYERLLRRVDQLDARLPTQTLTSSVPILNTFGGFEMFSNGTTDLAPELYGWYGAPGIDPDAESTTLFLVGDHFSPLRTQVIVGNQAINSIAMPTGTPGAAQPASYQKLLSRQVIQVTFPKGAYTVPTVEGGEVRIHLATPYGVTRELAVPVASKKPIPKPGISVAGAKLGVQIVKVQQAAGNSTQQGRAGQQGAGQQGADTSPTQTAKASGWVGVGLDQDTFKLTWVGLDPTAVTATDLRVQFVFSVPGATGQPAATVVVPCGDGVPASLALTPPASATASNSGALTIKKEDLQRLAADLLVQPYVQALAESGQLFNGLTTTQIVVTALDPVKRTPTRSILTNDQLTVGFKVGTYTPGCEFPATVCKTNYALAPGAKASIAYTLDANKQIASVAVIFADVTIQATPAANPPTTVTVQLAAAGPKDTSVPLKGTTSTPSAYTIDTKTFATVVGPWLENLKSKDEALIKGVGTINLQVLSLDGDKTITTVLKDGVPITVTDVTAVPKK